jgi:hypothetical protein
MTEKVSELSWARRQVDSAAAIEEYRKMLTDGDHMAVYKLIEVGFVTGRYGGWFEESEKLWNDHLGLPKAENEDVVRDAVEKMM